MSRMNPGAAFALWAFGSSPQKKCEDINELVPLQAAGGAVRTLDKALSTLQPKAARAPAMDALQAALKLRAGGMETQSQPFLSPERETIAPAIFAAPGDGFIVFIPKPG